MNFILDLHCHTISSTHAYSTITENAAHAAKIGLTHIGMANHGPGMPDGAHRYHFFNLRAVPQVIHGVHILKGIEANILNSSGELDFPTEYLLMMDFTIASMHREVIVPSSQKDDTAAIVNAMENPGVCIIGHPTNVVYNIDVEAVVKAAAKTRTILEINNASQVPGSFRYDGDEDAKLMLKLCKEHGVSILASSDAHYHESVGDFTHIMPLIEESGICKSQIINTCASKLTHAIQAKRELFA